MSRVFVVSTVALGAAVLFAGWTSRRADRLINASGPIFTGLESDAIDPRAPRYFSDLTRQADEAVVLTLADKEKNPKRATVTDAAWRERLAAVLEHAVYQPLPPSLCISFPEILLDRDGKETLRLFIRTKTLRILTPSGKGGDYLVGEDVTNKIRDLLRSSDAGGTSGSATHESLSATCYFRAVVWDPKSDIRPRHRLHRAALRRVHATDHSGRRVEERGLTRQTTESETRDRAGSSV